MRALSPTVTVVQEGKIQSAKVHHLMLVLSGSASDVKSEVDQRLSTISGG